MKHRICIFIFTLLSLRMFVFASNDNCANAISLGTVSTTTTVTGSNAGMSADQSNSGCFTYVTNVWYTFTVPAGGGSYAISVVRGTIMEPAVAVFSGACGSLTQLACNSYCNGTGFWNSVSTSVNCLNAGTYYIAVDDDATGFCTGTAGTFSLTVTQTSAGGIPLNDACAGAINLGTVSTSTTITGTNTCASADGTNPGCFTDTLNVWYKFTVPASGGSYNVTVNAGTMQSPAVAVFQAAAVRLPS